MARTKISEFSATPNDNTDIDGIDIAEGCAPSGINNAIRELMSQLKDFQTGSAGDPFNGAINGTVGATTPSTVVATQVDITAQGDLRLQDTTGGQYVALQAPGTVATSYTLTLPVDDGTAGQALITDGSGVLSWSSAASGDVYGPGSATDNAVARYDGTTGKIIQNSAVTIGDDGATVIAANSSSDGLRITQTGAGNALLVEDSANPDSSPFAILSNGQVIQGATQSYTTTVAGTNYNPTIQMHAANANTPAIGYEVANWATTTGAGSFSFAKSRGGVIGTHTVVNSNDSVGETYYFGSDGTNFIEAARIGAAVDGTPGTNDMPGRLVFSTTADGASSPTEAMRIDNQRRVGIGGTPYAGSSLVVGKANTGSTQVYAVSSEGTIQSDVTGTARLFYTAAKTQAASFTLTALKHYSADQGTFGATSAVTNQYGFDVNATLTGATNNYGFYGNIASGTGRWNFYAAGTADNYFAGNVGIGAAASGYKFLVYNTAASHGLARLEQANISYNTDLELYNANNITSISLLSKRTTGDLWLYQSGANQISALTSGVTRFNISGTGTISLGAAPGSESLRVTPVASAVNFLNILGGVTGNGITITSANSSDTNVYNAYSTKGTGAHYFQTGSGSFNQFVVAHTASAVNYLQVTGAATGGTPYFQLSGTDTNIGLSFYTKGSGAYYFNGNNATQVTIASVASAVNYLQLSGAATTGAPAISAAGSDTNIDIALTPKGTGVLSFGTYTAGVVTQAGYITIKDAAGNTRRLLVG